jgi:CO dehydrogenase/acetyl-CoA synthase beta subunit
LSTKDYFYLPSTNSTTNTNAATIQKDLDSAVTETPELEKALDEFAAFLKQHEIPANSGSEVEIDDEDEEDDEEGEEL